MEASVSGGAAAPGRSGDGGGGSRADVADDLDDLLDSALDDFDRVSGSAAATSSSSTSGVGGGATTGPGTLTVPLNTDAATAAAAGVASSSTAAAAGPSSSAAAQAPPEEVKGLGGGLRPLGPRKQGKKKKGGTGSGVGPSTQDATPSSSSSRVAAAAGATSRQQQQQQQRPAPAAKSLRDTLEQLQARTRQTVDGMRAQDREREAAAADRARQEGLEGEEGMGLEDEEMMEKLMKQFEDMGNQDIQGLMDVVMQQLLSKDVLYEPMREIGERYPAWLQANRATLSPDDVARYSRQHECILRLCRLYEASPPAEFGQIVAVMKEMQECGQPPADIIKDLAPGLELGEDGLPMFPDLLGSGSGDLPRDCSIM